MTDSRKIIVDGHMESGPATAVLPTFEFALTNPEVEITLLGVCQELPTYIEANRLRLPPNVQLEQAEFGIGMHEVPQVGMKNRKSTLAGIVRAVAQDLAHVCVSGGNTGVFIGNLNRQIGIEDGIGRLPPLATFVPAFANQAGRDVTLMLDVGVSEGPNTESLVAMARLGEEYYHLLYPGTDPEIRLLNVGIESWKGGPERKEAYRLLMAERPYQFMGNIEGNQILDGFTDIVITDGVAGNVCLKSLEGGTGAMGREMRHSAMQMPLWRKLLYKKSGQPVVNSFKKLVDPRLFGGAAILGLKGGMKAVKVHGGASQDAFYGGLVLAYRWALTKGL